MADNRNRKRPIPVKFFINAEELELIKKRMSDLGMDNLSAYLRNIEYDLVGFIPVDELMKAEKV